MNTSCLKLLVLSDLHLEQSAPLAIPAEVAFDAVVLAGDINTPGRRVVAWAQRESTFGGKPVIVIPGNHEFYRTEIHAELAEMRRAAQGGNVHVLNRDEVVINGVRFLGCMLWTDFELPMRRGEGEMKSDISAALAEANRSLNDFACIQIASNDERDGQQRSTKRQFRAEDSLDLHRADRAWLQRELMKSFDGPTVVVTHHAPSSGSVAARYQGDALTPAFVSELPSSYFAVPRLWVHGHTHNSADYTVGACRVVSNPRGYRLVDGSFENPHFDPGLIMEVVAN